MNPLVSSLIRPPQRLPRHHHLRHHRQVNRQSPSHQIQKVTGVKRRRNTALRTVTSGEENGESRTMCGAGKGALHKKIV